MKVYLLDANVLIRAHADYYPIDRVPPFWDWLLQMASTGQVKMPSEVYDEVSGSLDLLGQWLQRPNVRTAMVLAEAADVRVVQRVLTLGYAPDLDDIEVVEIGKDPFLIAAAVVGAPDRVVVTREVSKSSKLRANRKVPDVCAAFGVECISDFEAWRRLNFRIV